MLSPVFMQNKWKKLQIVKWNQKVNNRQNHIFQMQQFLQFASFHPKNVQQNFSLLVAGEHWTGILIKFWYWWCFISNASSLLFIWNIEKNAFLRYIEKAPSSVSTIRSQKNLILHRCIAIWLQRWVNFQAWKETKNGKINVMLDAHVKARLAFCFKLKFMWFVAVNNYFYELFNYMDYATTLPSKLTRFVNKEKRKFGECVDRNVCVWTFRHKTHRKNRSEWSNTSQR